METLSWKPCDNFVFLSGVMPNVYVKTLDTHPITLAFSLTPENAEENPLLIVSVRKDTDNKTCQLNYLYQVSNVICSNEMSKPFDIKHLCSIIGCIVNDAMNE
jgi:hypothetical protein